MDGMNQILKMQLTEKEVIIYLIVSNSKHNLRDIGAWLGVSPETVRTYYNQASEKMKFYADNGKLQTEIEQPTN